MCVFDHARLLLLSIIAGHYSAGTLSLLTGPSVTSLVQEITLAGQQVRSRGAGDFPYVCLTRIAERLSLCLSHSHSKPGRLENVFPCMCKRRSTTWAT